MSVSQNVCSMKAYKVTIVNRKENTIIAHEIYLAINEAGAVVKAYKKNADAVKGKYAGYFAQLIGEYETAIGKPSTQPIARSSRE